MSKKEEEEDDEEEEEHLTSIYSIDDRRGLIPRIAYSFNCHPR